jgi:hypothetical protein
VSVAIDAKIHKGVTVPVSMTGTRYFKAPDKEALKMNTVPSIAKPFQDIYSSLGTPATWPRIYNITESTPSVSSDKPMYELRATNKKPGNVDHILLDVDATTFDPVQARWFYKNGATIVLNVEEQVVDGKYRLPAHETVAVSFPQYKGDADVKYGSYTTNQTIPDDVFSK